MPIWLRKFTYNKIKEFYKPTSEDEESWTNQDNKNLAKKNQKAVIKPPSYITKLKKKQPKYL